PLRWFYGRDRSGGLPSRSPDLTPPPPVPPPLATWRTRAGPQQGWLPRAPDVQEFRQIRFRPGCESRTGDSGGPTSCASSSPSTPSPSSSGPLNSTTNFFDAVMQVRVHTVRRLIHACLFQSRSLNKCSERGRYGRLAVSSMCFLTSSSVLQLGCSF
uniref:Uncharacterized protein n=1 Tax=Triticum urartu TaxID=4572 RepID=A0A8R7PMF6_TRIUA